MRDISVAPSLRSSLLAALRHRLESLPPGSAEPIRSRASDDDAEEALRRVSVPARKLDHRNSNRSNGDHRAAGHGAGGPARSGP